MLSIYWLLTQFALFCRCVFHYAEVAARPVSHAEYSGFDMEAESDTSDVFGSSQSSNAVTQKQVPNDNKSNLVKNAKECALPAWTEREPQSAQ